MLRECPNFQGGTGGKIMENGSKTGKFPCYAHGEEENSRSEFSQIPLVSISRHSITILLHYKKIYPKK